MLPGSMLDPGKLNQVKSTSRKPARPSLSVSQHRCAYLTSPHSICSPRRVLSLTLVSPAVSTLFHSLWITVLMNQRRMLRIKCDNPSLNSFFHPINTSAFHPVRTLVLISVAVHTHTQFSLSRSLFLLTPANAGVCTAQTFALSQLKVWLHRLNLKSPSAFLW